MAHWAVNFASDFLVSKLTCAPIFLSRSLNTVEMATSSYTKDDFLETLEEESDSGVGGMSAGEEEDLDDEMEGSDDSSRQVFMYFSHVDERA